MARGEATGGSTARARGLVLFVMLGVAILTLVTAALFPRIAQRPLLGDLWIRRVDTALGSHCEIARPEQHLATRWSCGADAHWPDYPGPCDVARVTDGHRVCALELATLRTVGCVDGDPGWLGVTAAQVVFVTREWVAGYRAGRQWVTRIDRASGTRSMVEVPLFSTPMFAGTELVAVLGEGRSVYALTGDGATPLWPDAAAARYRLALTTMRP
jgi:hypothetical protein